MPARIARGALVGTRNIGVDRRRDSWSHHCRVVVGSSESKVDSFSSSLPGDDLRSRHTRPRAVARPMASPASASGSVTGRVVGRRRCSKRLAFYDLRELVACDVDAGALPSLVHRRAPSSPSSSALAAAADASSSPHPVFAPTDSVELVAKSGAAGGFADEAALAAAQREALKLGNVVRVRGAWSVEGEDEVRVLVDRVELVERWADANPGTHFTRSAPPSSSGRKPETAAAGEPDPPPRERPAARAV
jgi:hypothetical protein